MSDVVRPEAEPLSSLPWVAVADASANRAPVEHPSAAPLAQLMLGGDIRFAESFTWQFGPVVVKYVDGSTCLSISNLSITKIRASLTGGGYRCQWTLAGDMNSNGATGNNPPNGYKPLDFRIDALNGPAGGHHGVLFSFQWSQVISCGPGRLYQTNAFDPDVYDIWLDATFTVLAHQNWLRCRGAQS